VARGDVVIVNLPAVSPGGGREQIGRRPALVVHDDSTSNALSVIMIVPFTGQPSASRFPHTIRVDPSPQNGLSAASILLVFQLRAIDRRRIGNTIGQLEPGLMTQVDEEMRRLLGL
jgi:mRNA interferase MazF